MVKFHNFTVYMYVCLRTPGCLVEGGFSKIARSLYNSVTEGLSFGLDPDTRTVPKNEIPMKKKKKKEKARRIPPMFK
jgi:hypothetical protein